MLTLDKKIKKWSRKINRNKTFTPIEMEEMEDHLLVEIKQMVQYDGVTEEKAFQKAVKTLGEQGILDEEFGKIRRSAFDKVKLWAYLQTFIILALAVFIAVPYIHLPRKETTDPFVGERIGTITAWEKERYRDCDRNIVSYKRETYFYDQWMDNIYCFQDTSSAPFYKYKFSGTYFPLKPKDLNGNYFDIDFQNNLFILNNKLIQVEKYKKSQLIGKYPLKDITNPDTIVGIKIIGQKLIVCFTKFGWMVSIGNLGKFEIKESDKTYFTNSVLQIYDLDLKQNDYSEIEINNTILSLDRSEDRLAILLDNGEIQTYSFKNNSLAIINNWKIENYLPLFTPGKESPQLIYSKRSNQIILKNNKKINEYYFLTSTDNTNLKVNLIIDKFIEGVIKMNYLGEERIVSIRNDFKFLYKDWIYNLHLFKN